jgi:hypothetical protein
MAEKNYNRNRDEVHLEDVVEVGSRVSWGAILAGAVMAMAVGFITTLIGQTLGLSLSDRASTDSLGLGAVVWTIFSSILALFVGGWVTSQCVVGETKTDSVVHGIIMWGVTLAMVLWGTGSGIHPNFTAMMPVTSIAGVTTEPGNRESFQATSATGIPQENALAVTRPNNAATNYQDSSRGNAPQPQHSGEADRRATRATLWTLVNAILSIVAAVGGAFVGAGPTFRLLPLHVAQRHSSARGTVPGGA